MLRSILLAIMQMHFGWKRWRVTWSSVMRLRVTATLKAMF